MMSFVYVLILFTYLFLVQLIVVFRQARQVQTALALYDEMFAKATSDAEKVIIQKLYDQHLARYTEVLRSRFGKLLRFIGLLHI